MKKVEVKKMQELKLRPLHRGFVLTDFDNNEVGCKDIEQALEEIKKLIVPDGKSEEQIKEKLITEDQIVENRVTKKHERKKRESAVELHRKIFEAAKEQINLLGRVNGAQIARDLNANASNVGSHLKQMEKELDDLIKNWQDERDKKMVNAQTRINIETEADAETIAGPSGDK